MLLIGCDDALAKGALMQALLNRGRDVASPGIRAFFGHAIASITESHNVVDADGERQTLRVVADDIHRPLRLVLTGHNPMEIHEWHLLEHRFPQQRIVAMIWIGSAVSYRMLSPDTSSSYGRSCPAT